MLFHLGEQYNILVDAIVKSSEIGKHPSGDNRGLLATPILGTIIGTRELTISGVFKGWRDATPLQVEEETYKVCEGKLPAALSVLLKDDKRAVNLTEGIFGMVDAVLEYASESNAPELVSLSEGLALPAATSPDGLIAIRDEYLRGLEMQCIVFNNFSKNFEVYWEFART